MIITRSSPCVDLYSINFTPHERPQYTVASDYSSDAKIPLDQKRIVLRMNKGKVPK
jgi:hypothetical protein